MPPCFFLGQLHTTTTPTTPITQPKPTTPTTSLHRQSKSTPQELCLHRASPPLSCTSRPIAAAVSHFTERRRNSTTVKHIRAPTTHHPHIHTCRPQNHDYQLVQSAECRVHNLNPGATEERMTPLTAQPYPVANFPLIISYAKSSAYGILYCSSSRDVDDCDRNVVSWTTHVSTPLNNGLLGHRNATKLRSSLLYEILFGPSHHDLGATSSRVWYVVAQSFAVRTNLSCFDRHLR
jgi:hypothetical protein